MRNILTVDLEDWYCSLSMAGTVPRSVWSTVESRVHVGTRAILDVLRRRNARATFFAVGCVAERDPDLVREIVDAGHEIASHGYAHHHLEDLGPQGFRDDLDKGLAVLHRITGRSPRGFRAPVFSVTARTVAWATEILASRDIVYDSSVFPMRYHPLYGMPHAPLAPYRHANGLLELPLACAEIFGARVPVAGGAYFRHTPYAVTAALAHRCNRAGRPLIFYIHPWEFDVTQPRLPLPAFSRLRHYRGLAANPGKLERLTEEFSFTSVETLIADGHFDAVA